MDSTTSLLAYFGLDPPLSSFVPYNLSLSLSLSLSLTFDKEEEEEEEEEEDLLSPLSLSFSLSDDPLPSFFLFLLLPLLPPFPLLSLSFLSFSSLKRERACPDNSRSKNWILCFPLKMCNKYESSLL